MKSQSRTRKPDIVAFHCYEGDVVYGSARAWSLLRLAGATEAPVGRRAIDGKKDEQALIGCKKAVIARPLAAGCLIWRRKAERGAISEIWIHRANL